MLIFRYDKTFEGLLTALFDAYNDKSFPEALLGANDIEPMFTSERYTVVTDESKSNRVWKGLEKKVSKLALNQLHYVWISELPGADFLLFRYIRKAFDSKTSIESNFADNDVLEVHQLARKVSHEKHYMLQFVRFQKAADDIFFAPVMPRYNVLPLTIRHFKDRFSDQKWVLYDTGRHYGFYYDLHSVIEITLDVDDHLLGGKLDEKLMAEDEKLFQDLWKGYFKALTIKERINPRKQRQDMPRRFWKYLTEMQ